MPKMHADELDVDEALVRRLLAEQFPQWAELRLERAEPAGTDNAIFRLGADLAVRAAADLAGFVGALQRIDHTGAPRGRGVPLAQLDESARAWIAQLGGDPVLTAVWEEALQVPVWTGAPTWHHGDLDVRNWLVCDGRICGVIDWDCMGVGDPACDVSVAWKLHSVEARGAFRGTLPVDDATWARARGWALWQAVGAVSYYTAETNPTLLHEGESWLEQVLLDRQ